MNELGPCVKKCYPDKASAKKALREQKHQRGKKPRHVYYCEHHSSWHLTSMTRTRYNEMVGRMKKQKDFTVN